MRMTSVDPSASASRPDLVQFLREELVPRLARTPERVFDHPAHRWRETGGVTWKGGCPWHDSQKGDAFQLRVADLSWRCFACDVGGGVVQYRHRLRGGSGPVRGHEFVDVLAELAEMVGLALPERARAAELVPAGRRQLLEAVLPLLQAALWEETSGARQARAYLAERGLEDGAVRAFGLGLYPGQRELLGTLPDELQEAARAVGLHSRRWGGFLLVPWRDAQGGLLTLYGRFHAQTPPLMRDRRGWGPKRDRLRAAWESVPGNTRRPWEEPRVPKTLALAGAGSKRSPFCFDRALAARHHELVVVEGVLDALVLQARGETNVVSPAGAALSGEQVEALVAHGVRVVTLVPDPDQGGQQGAVSSLRRLTAAGIAARLAPALPHGLDPDEYVLREGVEAWRSHVGRAVAQPGCLRSEAQEASSQGDWRPRIEVGPLVKENVDAADAALAAAVAAGRLELFQRGGELVRAVEVGGRPTITGLHASNLVEILSDVARWIGHDRKGDERLVPPQTEVVKALFNRGRWGVPEVERVSDVPVFRPDGTLRTAPGYDAATRILYRPSLAFPLIPESPSEDDARGALEVLKALFLDFPFVQPSDLSATLALVLTLLARPGIPGPTPLFLVEAAEAGTGKGLLTNVAALIATGGTHQVVTHESREEETKRLLALGREGAVFAVIDNIERAFGSDVLCAALTSCTFRARLLATNTTLEVPVPVLAATGNNVLVRGDLRRRVVPIHMVAGVERPDERTGFRIPDLLGHVRRHRAELVAAGLMILRWQAVEAGSSGLKPFGSFEDWSRVVREPLVALGEPDPLAGRERVRATGDPMGEALGVALELWHEQFGEVPRTAVELAADGGEELRLALAALDLRLDAKALDSRVLGYALRRHKDRVVGGRRLERAEDRSRLGTRWRVSRVGAARG